MLIECDECGNQVSDKATACPNCGAPIESFNQDISSNTDDQQKVYVENTSKYLKKNSMIFAILLILGPFLMLFGMLVKALFPIGLIFTIIGFIGLTIYSFKIWWHHG